MQGKIKAYTYFDMPIYSYYFNIYIYIYIYSIIIKHLLYFQEIYYRITVIANFIENLFLHK